MTFSMYVKEAGGNSSSIKFGGYDPSGADGVIHFYKSKKNDDWVLKGGNMRVNGHPAINSEREMRFTPELPYLYIPAQDFAEF